MRLYERWLFCKEHPAYTYAAYDAAKAGDIALDAEFGKVYLAMLDKAKNETEAATHGS